VEDLIITQQALNLALLDETLRAALGEVVAGVSATRGEVRVHFTRRPTAEEVARARLLVEQHDATALTAEQQALVEQREQHDALHRTVSHLDLSAPLTADALDTAVRWLLLREQARALPPEAGAVVL
jgi:hypothetical protein